MAQGKEKPEDAQTSISQVQSAAKILEMLYEKMPSGAHKDQALMALEESVMWANKAISG